MPTTYVGSPALNTSITIPVDGDNANANSVNVSSKAMVDTQTLLYQIYGQLMQSTCPIRVYDLGNNVDIKIEPIPSVLVSEAGAWKVVFTTTATTIGVAEIEGAPGAYSPSTWYYIYAYSDMGTCKFQISPTSPDKYNLYKNGTFSHKFIASFKTDSGSLIIRFNKYGNFVQYLTPQPIGSGVATTETLLNSASFIPPNAAVTTISRMGKFVINVIITAANSATIFLSGESGQNGIPITYATGMTSTFFVDSPVDSQRRLFYKVPLGTGTLVINYFIYGYYE